MREFVFLGITVLACALSGFAQQEPVRPEESQEEPDPRDVRRAPERPASLTDKMLQDRRSSFGFTAGAFEAYSSNLFNTGYDVTGGAITLLSSQVFTNLGRRRNRFHADYGIGYRMYANSDHPDGADHRGLIDFESQLSKGIAWSLYDDVSSMRNDYITYLGPTGSLPDTPNSPERVAMGEYILQPQKTFRNDAATALGFQLGKDTNFKVTGGYQTVRYDLSTLYNQDAFYGAASLSHRFTKWLSFSSSYTRYFARTTSYFTDTSIQHLQVGQFEFSLSKNWVARAAGGLEYADYVESQFTGSADASLAHTSPHNRFQVSYHRGLTSLFGIPGVFVANTGNLNFVQTITRQVSFEALANYERGTYWQNSGNFQFYSALASLQFGLRHDMVASANLEYRKQNTENLSYGVWDFKRYIVFAGLQYVWAKGR